MDAVFGWKQFRNEVIWDYTFRLMDLPKFFNRKHDVILFYGKTPKSNFSMPKTPWTREEIIKTRKQRIHLDEHGNEMIWMPGGKGNSKNKLKKISDIIEEGKAISDVWRMPIISSSSKERYGYPTQKPLALYELIIKASSNEQDFILDPFCGCATTLVAAEKLGRQWVGMDIWERAHEVVEDRLRNEVGLFGNVIYETTSPERTDEGEEAAPFLRVKQRVKEPEGPRWTRAQMFEHLLEQDGPRCQGCDRAFDDPRYLELDHNIPRSDGGINHITNRILLCGPCNRLKSNTYTLSGLRRENKKRGFMT